MWFCRVADGGKEDAVMCKDPRGTRAPTVVRGKRGGGGKNERV